MVSVAVDAAIDLSTGSFAGRLDFDDGGLGIELMIFADMLDIAGADLIEGLWTEVTALAIPVMVGAVALAATEGLAPMRFSI